MAHETSEAASGGSGPQPVGTAAQHSPHLADLEEELVRIGGGHLANRAARRAADAEVVRRLRQVGFKGPLYDTFMEQQMRYGWSVLNHWCASGEVFARARAFGRPVPDDMITTPWLRDDRHEVADETTIAAARLFRRHALLSGRFVSADLVSGLCACPLGDVMPGR